MEIDARKNVHMGEETGIIVTVIPYDSFRIFGKQIYFGPLMVAAVSPIVLDINLPRSMCPLFRISARLRDDFKVFHRQLEEI